MFKLVSSTAAEYRTEASLKCVIGEDRRSVESVYSGAGVKRTLGWAYALNRSICATCRATHRTSRRVEASHGRP